MESVQTFERLVQEAKLRNFSGWNFSYLGGRYEEYKASWNLRGLILQRLNHAGSLLDLGTGGGEFLRSLQPLPRRTCVTEGYPPNAKIAKRRLKGLGVEAVLTHCEDNGGTTPQKGALPFRTETFDVVMDRHEAYIATEVYRVLKPNGVFITQQVGDGNNDELRDFLGEQDKKAKHPSWNLERAVVELESAGFDVEDQRADIGKSHFFDVGAVVYYLKAIPWEIAGFNTETYSQVLRELDRTIRSKGFFEVTTKRFLVIAVKQQTSQQATILHSREFPTINNGRR